MTTNSQDPLQLTIIRTVKYRKGYFGRSLGLRHLHPYSVHIILPFWGAVSVTEVEGLDCGRQTSHLDSLPCVKCNIDRPIATDLRLVYLCAVANLVCLLPRSRSRVTDA